jgi:nitrate reductase NapAB chaperone NapD
MDQLSIQAGDHIVVPVERAGRGMFPQTLTVVRTVGSVIALFFTFSRFF